MLNRAIGKDQWRSLLRKVQYANGRTSYPFISGDTYASLCDYIYDDGDNFFCTIRPGSDIFLPARLSNSFIDLLKSDSRNFKSNSLYIHNYDNIPNNSEMSYLASRFSKVYSVNWLGPRNIAEPIPIGLENFQHLRNGVPYDFKKLIKRGIPAFGSRPINILSGFSLSTNLEVRSRALEFAKQRSDVHHLPEFTTPKKYRELLLQSKFVLSPPGNGADCHRTWEAIYLGAVPIVLRSYWPFSHLDLPVLITDEWGDLDSLISEYKPTKYLDVYSLAQLFLKK